MKKNILSKNEEHGYFYVDESRDKLKDFYQKEYYQVHKDGFLKSRNLNDGKIDRQPLKEIDELEWLIESEYSKINDIATENLCGLEKNMLDVGCGAGNLMRYMKSQGWIVKGIEPSKVYNEEMKKDGLNVFNGLLDEFCEENNDTFSLITLNHVVEHVSNPNEVLLQCRNLLKKNGLIYIKVPNDFNNLQKIANELVDKNEWWIALPDHLSYFNRDTLKSLLKSLDFEIIYEGIDFPMELFVLMGLNYIDQPLLGKECHKMRKNLEVNLGKEQKELLYNNFMKMGWGRNIFIIAKLNNTEEERI